jgi:hypothetical protein
MAGTEQDTLMRLAAFEHVRWLTAAHPVLTPAELSPGFVFDGQRIPFVNPQRGILPPPRVRATFIPERRSDKLAGRRDCLK